MSDSALEREVIRQIAQVLAEGEKAEGEVVVAVPACVVLDPSLSYAAIGVLAVLALLHDGIDDVVALEVLAGRGLTLCEVADALVELQGRGLVCRRLSP